MPSATQINCEEMGNFGRGHKGSLNPRRDSLMKDLYQRGKGYSELGRMFGISRQRVHQVINHYIMHGRQGRAEKYEKTFGRCARCGSTKKPILHHVDFDNSNDSAENLLCLCTTCHVAVHKEERSRLTTVRHSGRVVSDTMAKLNWLQQKYRNEKISHAIEAQRLRDAGLSDGDLMNHFKVSARTLARWFKFLSHEVPEGGSN